MQRGHGSNTNGTIKLSPLQERRPLGRAPIAEPTRSEPAPPFVTANERDLSGHLERVSRTSFRLGAYVVAVTIRCAAFDVPPSPPPPVRPPASDTLGEGAWLSAGNSLTISNNGVPPTKPRRGPIDLYIPPAWVQPSPPGPMLLLCFAMAFLTFGCNEKNGGGASSLLQLLGLRDGARPEPGRISVLCDSSTGATCNPKTLRTSLTRVFEEVSERPGSEVDLWMLGATVEDAALVGSATVEGMPKGNRREQRAATKQWAHQEIERLLREAEPYFEKTLSASPLIGTIARIRGDNVNMKRAIVAVTDGREYSDLGDFECGKLPDPDVFAERLALEQILPPGSLQGVDIHITYVDIVPIDSRRCQASFDRAARTKQIWMTVLDRAGASTVIRSGAAEFRSQDSIATGEEP